MANNVARSLVIPSIAGTLVESTVARRLQHAAEMLWKSEGIRVHIIQGSDHSVSDLLLLPGELDDDFPHHTEPSDIRRLEWAVNQKQAVTCDVKTGTPRMEWLRDSRRYRMQEKGHTMDSNGAKGAEACTIDVFLLCQIEKPDWLVALPRDRVTGLALAMSTWVYERPRPLPDVEEYASSHACCLAPYAVHRIHWPRLLTALVYGPSDLPFVYPTSNIVLRQWNLQEDPYRPAGTPKRRSVADHIRCSDPAHDVAFGEMLRFGQWLRQDQPEVELHRVPHIPLGGDFLLRVGSLSQDPTFFIEHKAHNSDMFGLDRRTHWDGLSGPKCQHLLLHQPPGQERVRFLARGRTISRWFLFTQNDAYDFVRTILAGYDKMALTRSITLAHFDPLACQTMSTGSPLDLSDGGSSMSIESTLDLLDGRSLTGPHTPQSFPLSAPRPGQKKRRPFGTRINAHAIQLWRYINNDPDNHNYSLVCILLDAAQHHPWAPLAVIPHLWTTKERLAFRTRQQVPVEWEDVLEKQLLGTRCVLLQTVTCTPGPHNTFDSIPIGQCYAVPHALPVTPQRFILLGWSANRTLMELTRIFMVPSDFLSLPSGAEKQQADNANRIAHGQQQTSSTPLYMPSRSLWNWPDRIQDHCTASQYWIRLPNVIAHLGELLSPSLPTMRIVHAEEDTAHPNRTFSKHDYQITLGAVLQAQVDLGPLVGPLKARELPDST